MNERAKNENTKQCYRQRMAQRKEHRLKDRAAEPEPRHRKKQKVTEVGSRDLERKQKEDARGNGEDVDETEIEHLHDAAIGHAKAGKLLPPPKEAPEEQMEDGKGEVEEPRGDGQPRCEARHLMFALSSELPIHQAPRLRMRGGTKLHSAE